MENSKKDVTKLKIIYVYKVANPANVANKSSSKSQHCDMCEKFSNPVSNYCMDCHNFICSFCEKSHSKTCEFASHKLLPKKDFVKICQKAKVSILLSGLNKEVSIVDKRMANVMFNIAKVEQSKIKQVKELKAFSQDFIDEIKQNERGLEKLIVDANDQVSKELKESRVLLKKRKQEVQSKITQLENAYRNEDSKTLEDTLNKISRVMERDTNKLKDSNDWTQDIQSPVTVKKVKKLDIKDAIEVTIGNEKQFIKLKEEEAIQAKGLFSALWTKTFWVSEKTMLDNIPEKLICVNSQLWNVDHSGQLRLYGNESPRVNSTEQGKLDWKNCVTLMDTGRIIVVCSDDKEPLCLDSKEQRSSESKQRRSSERKGPRRSESKELRSSVSRERHSSESKEQGIERRNSESKEQGRERHSSESKEQHSSEGKELGRERRSSESKEQPSSEIREQSSSESKEQGSAEGKEQQSSDGNDEHECHQSDEEDPPIVQGNFSDVTLYDGELYGLERVQRLLIIFEKKNDKWTPKKEYNLEHDAKGRVFVNDKGIYISSYNNHCIYAYDAQGNLKEQIGGHGSGPGEFHGPFLCGIDEVGNILVADYWNNRIQVFDCTNGDWHVVELPTELKEPIQVVVKDGGEMWVVYHDPCVLVKFTTS